MRVTARLLNETRQLSGTILVFRQSLHRPLRSHPGPLLPSDTNPFARDPPSSPHDTSPSLSNNEGSSLLEKLAKQNNAQPESLRTRVRQVGNSRYVDYQKQQHPPAEHGVPPNFPDDQLEKKGSKFGIGTIFFALFIMSVLDDIIFGKERHEAMEKRKREHQERREAMAKREAALKSGEGLEGVRNEQGQIIAANTDYTVAERAAGRDEANQRMAAHGQDTAEQEAWGERVRAMNEQRRQVEERARRIQAGAAGQQRQDSSAWSGDNQSWGAGETGRVQQRHGQSQWDEPAVGNQSSTGAGRW